MPVGHIDPLCVGHDHTDRTGGPCEVRSGPENCKNEGRPMEPSSCDAKPVWFASESARVYSRMYLLRLGPVRSVVMERLDDCAVNWKLM